MKKSGFTLAELLVALGIIGIITAVLIPAINHAMPDKNKTMYLKAYDTLSETIKNLASNSKIYPVCEQGHNVNCSQNPLLNTGAPLISPLNSNERYSGNVKLCNLLALSLGALNANCSASAYNYSNDTFKNNLSFTTPNGMQWIVTQQSLSFTEDPDGGGRATFQSDIYVDINGTKGNNCIYSDTCETPDIFKFMIAADGTVVPADPMGRAYITSRKSLLKKNVVINNNTNILASLNDFQDDLGSFSYDACSRDMVTPEIPGGGGGGGDEAPPEACTPGNINYNWQARGFAYSSHLEVYGLPGVADGTKQITSQNFADLYKNNAVIMLHRDNNNDSPTSKIRSRLEELSDYAVQAIYSDSACVNSATTSISTASNVTVNSFMSKSGRKGGSRDNTEGTALGTRVANLIKANYFPKDVDGKFQGVVKWTDFKDKDYQVNMVSFRELVDSILMNSGTLH